jgi:hypothetical protein
MEERRKYQRFPTTFPVRIKQITPDRKKVFELQTRNISASGAFIDTKSPFSEGTRIKMDLIAKSKKIEKLTGAQSLIECEGVIIRSTPEGIAICFDKNCQILSLKNSNS